MAVVLRSVFIDDLHSRVHRNHLNNSSYLGFPMISNAQVDRLIAELRTHPLAEGELRQVKEGLYVSLSQSQPEGFEYAFCLSSGGRMYFFFRKAG
jgi:hypothetical protein